MLEFISGIFVGYLLNWVALAVVLILGILAEHYDHPKMAVFLGLVGAIIAGVMFNVPLLTLEIIAVSYLIIGVLWSFWRYTRFVSAGVQKLKVLKPSIQERQWKIKDLSPKENVGKIVRWVLIWPLSLVENVIGDIINLVQKLVTKVFNEVYEKIFTSYTKDI